MIGFWGAGERSPPVSKGLRHLFKCEVKYYDNAEKHSLEMKCKSKQDIKISKGGGVVAGSESVDLLRSPPDHHHSRRRRLKSEASQK